MSVAFAQFWGHPPPGDHAVPRAGRRRRGARARAPVRRAARDPLGRPLLGILGRRYGLTSDQVVAAQVVLADGRVVECDGDHEPDLFWALRGAGLRRVKAAYDPGAVFRFAQSL